MRKMRKLGKKWQNLYGNIIYMDNRIVDSQPVLTTLSDITKFVHQNLNEFAQIV